MLTENEEKKENDQVIVEPDTVKNESNTSKGKKLLRFLLTGNYLPFIIPFSIMFLLVILGFFYKTLNFIFIFLFPIFFGYMSFKSLNGKNVRLIYIVEFFINLSGAIGVILLMAPYFKKELLEEDKVGRLLIDFLENKSWLIDISSITIILCFMYFFTVKIVSSFSKIVKSRN